MDKVKAEENIRKFAENSGRLIGLTKTILNEILDPWDSTSNNFILKLGINLIKGPVFNPKDKNSRHIIEFIYENSTADYNSCRTC